MSVRRICKYGEEILNKKTKTVRFEDIKDRLPELLRDFLDTCRAANGYGLAANQIGLDMRIAIILIPEGKTLRRLFLINPKIVEKTGVMSEEEGCLSFPGLFARTQRYGHVKVLALNEKGIPIEITAEGLLAKALQHEIDHLDGKVFLDRVPAAERNRIKLSLKKRIKQWAAIDETKFKTDENGVHGDPGTGGSVSEGS